MAATIDNREGEGRHTSERASAHRLFSALMCAGTWEAKGEFRGLSTGDPARQTAKAREGRAHSGEEQEGRGQRTGTGHVPLHGATQGRRVTDRRQARGPHLPAVPAASTRVTCKPPGGAGPAGTRCAGCLREASCRSECERASDPRGRARGRRRGRVERARRRRASLRRRWAVRRRRGGRRGRRRARRCRSEAGGADEGLGWGRAGSWQTGEREVKSESGERESARLKEVRGAPHSREKRVDSICTPRQPMREGGRARERRTGNSRRTGPEKRGRSLKDARGLERTGEGCRGRVRPAVAG